MQKFHFRLETLLKYRTMQKEQIEIKFAQATQVMEAERERLVEMNETMAKNMEVLRDKQQEVLPVETLKVFQNFFDKIKEEICGQSQRVQAAEQYQAQCLRELEDIVKQVDIVEKLRVKRVLQYRLEQLAEEQKTLDEIGLQLHVRDK